MLHSRLPVPYAGPSSYVMLLIVLVRCTGYTVCMPIWGFYDKTNIVTLTCTSSPLRRVAVVELGILVRVSWVCPGGLPDVRDRQRAFGPMVGGKMLYMSVGVNKGLG